MRGAFELGGYWLDREPGRPGWYAYWYDRRARKTRRRSLGREDLGLEAAKLAISEFVLKRSRPRDAEPEQVRLAVIMDAYLTEVSDRKPSADQARYAARYIAGFFGGELVSDLTPQRQREFIRHLGGKGHSPRYVSRTMSVLSAAIGHARAEDVLKHAPRIILAIKDIEPEIGAAAPESFRRLSLEELGAFLDAIRADHVWRYTLLALTTLARPDALTELLKAQVDLETGIIHLNPRGRVQTRKHRPIVPICATLRPWLAVWKQDGKSLHLVHYKKGRPVGNPKKAVRETAIRAGLMPKGKQDDVTMNVTPYTLRRSMAREMRRRGVPLEQIEALLGHKARGHETTEIYADVVPDTLKTATSAIDNILGELQAHTHKTLRPAPTMHPQGKKRGASRHG